MGSNEKTILIKNCQEMEIYSQIINSMHLDRTYSLLTVKNTTLLHEIFQMLDAHNLGVLNDVQFTSFLKSVSPLKNDYIQRIFHMIDRQGRGDILWQDFYLVVAILISLKDRNEKQFIFRHSKIVFDLMDEDGGGTISADEFKKYGFLFNLSDQSVLDIFHDFDVSGDEELDYKEFKMFAMACIDKQREMEEKRRESLKKRQESDQNTIVRCAIL